jgi:hypothetical protein
VSGSQLAAGSPKSLTNRRRSAAVPHGSSCDRRRVASRSAADVPSKAPSKAGWDWVKRSSTVGKTCLIRSARLFLPHFWLKEMSRRVKLGRLLWCSGRPGVNEWVCVVFVKQKKASPDCFDLQGFPTWFEHIMIQNQPLQLREGPNLTRNNLKPVP